MGLLRTHRSNRPVRRSSIVSGLFLLIPVVMLGACGGSAASSTGSGGLPSLKMSDTSGGWVFHDGQTITVSMGPNRRFAPLSHVNIIQCSDPGGKAANLPTKFIDCDENTIQGDTVAVRSNGSFSEPAYVLYRLPSAALGESRTSQPACNQADPCVLLISEYQTDLTKPKVFSHPFVVLPSGGSQGGA